MKIASACGVTLHAPKHAKITFFNSPYPAHCEKKAVDIYFGDEIALSPVEGKVVEIRKFEVAKPAYFFKVLDRDAFDFKGEKYEYATIIRSSENPNKVVKIIHMKPFVKKGEKVEVFQEIGELIRSRLFTFWTGKHIHVEIRNPNDALRARGGEELKIIGNKEAKRAKVELKGRLVYINENLAKFALESITKAGSFYGVPALAGENAGLIDGGIPYNGYGAILTKVEEGSQVIIANFEVGRIVKSYEDASIFACRGFQVKALGLKLRGLSLTLSLQNNCKISLIPNKRGDWFGRNKTSQARI